VIRLLVRTAIALVANGVGLIVAAALLGGVNLNATGFIVAVAVFTIVYALMQPFLASQLRRGGRSSSLLGGVALLATLVSLVVTVLLTDGLEISGVVDWIAATVIVWLASVLAAFLLPYLGLKKYLEERER
jgi:putative membrane protein